MYLERKPVARLFPDPSGRPGMGVLILRPDIQKILGRHASGPRLVQLTPDEADDREKLLCSEGKEMCSERFLRREWELLAWEVANRLYNFYDFLRNSHGPLR